MIPAKDSVILVLTAITLFSLIVGGYFYLQDESLKKTPVNLIESPTPSSIFYPTISISVTETTATTTVAPTGE